MVPLFLTNTFGAIKEQFIPQNPHKVSIYVCGITPYDHSHIGHGRVYVCFDVLYRLLKFLGYNPIYVRNITDIDDKLLNKAEALWGDKMRYQELATKYTADFHEQMKKLNCLSPDIEPRATEYINEMLELTQTLIQKGHAYVVDSDVYFRVERCKNYGKLSGKILDELVAGARVATNEKKENPADFVLWKGTAEGEFWKSPWGYGRPGWHLECSAMILKTLGKTIDIHCGGIDLIFPHHENEIAQSECATGQTFTAYFLHNEFVNLSSEKMSKSLGNIITLNDALNQHHPMVWRFYILQHHYRMPIDFTDIGLQAAKTAYQKIINALNEQTIASPDVLKSITESGEAIFDLLFEKNGSLKTMDSKTLLDHCHEKPILKQLLEALCDDLNSPKFLGIVFENLSEIKKDGLLALAVKSLFQLILGLDCKIIEITATPKIEELLKERDAARAEKNWKKADEIRDQLTQLGWTIKDKKQGKE